MNKVVLIGRLVRDAELKFTAGKGTPTLKFTMAVDDGYGDNKKTSFLPIIVFGKSAETLANYLFKGSLIGVSGKIQTGSYDNKEGKKVYTTEIIADMYGGIKLLEGKKNDNSSSSNQFDNMNFDEDLTPVDDGDMPF